MSATDQTAPGAFDTLSPTSQERLSSRTSLLDVPPEQNAKRSAIAGAGAFLLHGGLVVLALTVGTRVTRRVTHLDVSQLIEVDLPPPPEAPQEVVEEPQPEPVVEPPPSNTPAAPAPEDPPPLDPSAETEEEPPPAPAESGEVLTASEEIVDFGDTIISGQGDRFAGGLTSADGASKVAVRNPNARPGGAVGGTGTGKPVREKKPVNQSRSPRLSGGMEWDCPFPAEADMEQVDNAAVSLQVQVAPNGKVQSVTVLSDPGFGFGREARRCAQRKRWDPGIDVNGAPVGGTARIKVRFKR